MSIFTQELLGLFKLGKRKTTYKPSQDYIEVGRLYSSSTLNTGSSYAPRMEPYMMKISDIGSSQILGGAGITVTNASGISTVNIDYLGADNFINIAPTTAAIKTDVFIFHSTTNTDVYKDYFYNMPGYYEGWVAIDSSNVSQAIDGNLKFNGINGITTAISSPNVLDVSLSNSGVVAGSYTSTDITVNAQGIITAASNNTTLPLASFSINLTGALLNQSNIANLTGLTTSLLATGVYQVSFNTLGNQTYLINAYVEIAYNNLPVSAIISNKYVDGFVVTLIDTTPTNIAAIVNIVMYA